MGIMTAVRRIAEWAGGRRLFVLVPCFVVLLWLISFSPFWFSEQSIKADYGVGTLDLQFANTVDHARATLDQLGDPGRRAYDAFQIIDLIFPASYALALSGLIWTCWGGAGRRWVTYLAAVPIVGAALDYLENLLVRVALTTYPNPSRAELGVGVTVTTAKLVLSYGSQFLVVVGLVVAVIARVRSQGSRSVIR